MVKVRELARQLELVVNCMICLLYIVCVGD